MNITLEKVPARLKTRHISGYNALFEYNAIYI